MSTYYTAQIPQAAMTLREGVFARLIEHIVFADGTADIKLWKPNFTGIPERISSPCGPVALVADIPLAALLEETEKAYHDAFTHIPFGHVTMTGRDLEFIEPLQDLAQIISIESTDACKAGYYPGVPDVEPLSTDHIAAVMDGLQREIDREAKRVGKVAPVFRDLPPERQRGLAERRRYWFAQYGITPESWPSGVFSLWDVSEMEFPEMLGGKTRP